jgi:hypothetical protein
MNENTKKYTKEEILKEVDVTEQIRNILDIPNKNNLYKDLGLNITYLNLKNFISGRDPVLKKKSVEYLSRKLNLLPLQLFIDIDTLDEEDIEALKKIQAKFLAKLADYAKKFENDKRRIKTRPITEEDIKKVENILNSAVVDIDLSDLDIEI